MNFKFHTIQNYWSTVKKKVINLKKYFYSNSTDSEQPHLKKNIIVRIKDKLIPNNSTKMLSGFVLLDLTPYGGLLLLVANYYWNRNQKISTDFQKFVVRFERFSFIFFMIDIILTGILLLTNNYVPLRIHSKTICFSLIIAWVNLRFFAYYLQNCDPEKSLPQKIFCLILSLWLFAGFVLAGNGHIAEWKHYQNSPEMIVGQPLPNVLKRSLHEYERHEKKPDYNEIENTATNWEKALEEREKVSQRCEKLNFLEKTLKDETIPGQTRNDRENYYEIKLDTVLNEQKIAAQEYQEIDADISEAEQAVLGDKVPVPDRYIIDRRPNQSIKEWFDELKVKRIKRSECLFNQETSQMLSEPEPVGNEIPQIGIKTQHVLGTESNLENIPMVKNPLVLGKDLDLPGVNVPGPEMSDWTEVKIIEVPGQEQTLVNQKGTKAETSTTGLTRKRKARVGRLSDLPRLPEDATNLPETNTPKVAVPPEKVR